MTSLSTLLLEFAVVGAIFTAITVVLKKHRVVWMSFLQHFVGVWFIFSGLVKAVDPIGTAYKMEDYFAAFENTFDGLHNMFKGLAPLFPWLSEHVNGFSITMIVLEIVLGIALIIGWRRKLTAWMFFLLMVVFTFLTGFTYLTGYVPSEANFFDFSAWGPYVKEQMRVTDCGCFGDFILLDPKISFFKDLGLMVPAFLFLFATGKMHEFWTKRTREIIVGVSTLLIAGFCLRNTYLDLPMVDFRPFKVGNNIRERKALEESAKVDILGWELENTKTGEKATYMEPEPNKFTYMKQYPADQGWKVKDQVKTDWYALKDGVKTPITKTKVSFFAVESADGDITEDILAEKGYTMMIIAYKLYGSQQNETITVQDTTWATDTIRVNKDSVRMQQRILSVQPKQVERKVFIPDSDYADYYTKGINPLAEAAEKAGWKVMAVTTYGDAEYAADFARKVGAKYPFDKADDKLLKTIIRANPGVVIWKDGSVVGMYHHRHIPTFEQVSATFK